jgi:hypothetical protein
MGRMAETGQAARVVFPCIVLSTIFWAPDYSSLRGPVLGLFTFIPSLWKLWVDRKLNVCCTVAADVKRRDVRRLQRSTSLAAAQGQAGVLE